MHVARRNDMVKRRRPWSPSRRELRANPFWNQVPTVRGGGTHSLAGNFLSSSSFVELLSFGPRLGSRSLLRTAPLSVKLPWKVRVSYRNIDDRSSSSSSSSSSPSAVSWSGGDIQSLGTTHGNATPILAALLSHDGGAFPVNCSHR